VNSTEVPMVRPTPAPLPMGTTCVSKMTYLPDSFCVGISCDPAYAAFCATNVASKSTVTKETACNYYAVGVNETLDDVAVALDEDIVEVRTRNIAAGLLADASAQVTLGSVLLVPGTCPSDTWAPTTTSGASMVAAPLVALMIAALAWM